MPLATAQSGGIWGKTDMRIEEARLLADWIASLNLPRGAVCLNVGSSTADFRQRIQPHIQRELFGPLEALGLRIVHCDAKAEPGVDEVGDLLDPAFRRRLQAYRAPVMICSNLLEHLTDPQTFASACGELVAVGGRGFITVPYSYPYHPDPIDTMLRPTPDELADMLPGWDLERGEILISGTYRDDLRQMPNGSAVLFRQLVRTLMPFYRASQWKHIAHRLLWLFRPFSISVVQMRKPN